VILKILGTYQITCNFCRKPYPIKDIKAHEGACERSKCSNELCGISLENLPDTVKFYIYGDEKVACSKKCKKVTKFSIMLRRNSEAEVLRAFETMLRKKSGKKPTQNPLLAGGNLTGRLGNMAQ
jgi:hypothetical protein